jgi:hypothetical protein
MRGLSGVTLLVFAIACGTPTSGSSSSSGRPLSLPAMKLAVLGAVGGKLDYCDPDIYPLAHGTPLDDAKRRLPSIQSDPATYQAILTHERISRGSPLTDAQIVAISQDYKQIQVIDLLPAGDAYRFTVYVPTKIYPSYNESVSGTVGSSGDVSLQPPGTGRLKNCPICLAFGVLIGTPAGQVPVQDVWPGMTVWTTDLEGRRIRGVVLQVGSMLAPLGHEVVRMTLSDGRMVVASPGHPTADGRRIGDLRPGDTLDGSRVVRTVLVPYTALATYDLLPSGPTGTYFADGVLLGSTLATASPPALRPVRARPTPRIESRGWSRSGFARL